MGGINFGWLTVWVLSQTGSVSACRYASFVRRFGEAAMPGKGEGWPCPNFAPYMAFALQLRENHGKTSVRVSERHSADQRRTRFL